MKEHRIRVRAYKKTTKDQVRTEAGAIDKVPYDKVQTIK